MTREEEERLIRRIKEGHIEAFAPLVEHYKRSIYVLVLRIVEQREEAEEVAQDVFLKAFQAIHSFDHRSRFSTWLYRIACNTALSTVRSRKRPFRLLGGARAEQITETLVEEDTAEPIGSTRRRPRRCGGRWIDFRPRSGHLFSSTTTKSSPSPRAGRCFIKPRTVSRCGFTASVKS